MCLSQFFKQFSISVLSIALIFVSNSLPGQINFQRSSSYKYLKGKDATSIPSNWMTSNYTPINWTTGSAPFRFGDGTGGTLLSDMQNNYSTLYLRSSFNAQNIANLNEVKISADYDDGFTVWINGVIALNVNAPALKGANSFATQQHESGTPETFTLPVKDLNIKEGENLLAVQSFNTSIESSDFLISLQISAEKAMPQINDSLKVRFSHPGGFYSSNFNLKLDVPDQSYTIAYTIDGSNPQTSSTAINGGKSKTISINPTSSAGRPKTPCYIVRASLKKDGFSPSFPLTQTYIFIEQVIDQANPGGGWPASSYVNDQQIDIEMDPDITNSLQYSNLIDDALTDIPSISIVTDLKDLFNATTGIYVNALSHGENWERFCSAELLDPKGKTGFNINAGLRIRGGWSRHGNYPKHAFRLFFREEYGASKLKFPLFDEEGVNEFDKIDLRCEQNYSWSNGDYRNTCVREVFSRDTQRDMGQPYTRSRYYHLYLNGMYWGLFQTQERSEARFASDYFGGSKEDYDVVKVNSDGYNVEATDGNLDSWQVLYNLCNNGFSNNENYFALEGKDGIGNPVKGGEVLVDIDNLIDYMLTIFYTGNFDAPTSSFMGNSGVNNFYAINRRDDKSEGFVFFNHDAEHAMMIDPASPGIGLYENRVQLDMSVSGLTKFHPQWLHHKLASNKEYRQRFADRVYKHFFNKGVFVPEVAQERFQKRVDEIDLAIIAESARWGDAQNWSPYTRDTWNEEVEDIYDRFFPYRTEIVLDQLIDAGLYTSFTPPVVKMNSVILDLDAYPNQGKSTLTLTCTNGVIYYTLDGSDPRMVGGQTNPVIHQLASGGTVEIEGTTIVKARVKAGENWSALRKIKFLNTNEDFSKLKVTEIHYHPTDSIIGTDTISGKSFEFFELKNTGEKSLNLSGIKFTSSIEYMYPTNEILAPKQFHVIASKPKWFYDRHGRIPSGNFEKNFSNSGEQVVITSAAGNEIINVTYSDTEPWPEEADGAGNSLSAKLRYPEGSPNEPEYWKNSTLFDGSPFADDPGIIDSNDEIEILSNTVAIYPNPTKGSIKIKISGLQQKATLEIFTIQGQLLTKSTITNNSIFDMSTLPINPGIVIFKIKTAGRTSVNKIIYQP